jgi:hypothetical protein
MNDEHFFQLCSRFAADAFDAASAVSMSCYTLGIQEATVLLTQQSVRAAWYYKMEA